jgi:predicted NUDIX family phosphoesterase
MTLVKNTNKIIPSSLNELILVVKRHHILPPTNDFQGFKQADCNSYLRTIELHKEFLLRSTMETDPTYKQIIPYLIFQHKDKFFLMQRHAKASETRLQGKLTLGIGGHIRQEDIARGTIADWAQREFHEEVQYSGSLTVTPLGLINDDSNEVGRVHIGFVFLLAGNSDAISVKSELHSGQLATYAECVEKNNYMESWSSIILPHLANR